MQKSSRVSRTSVSVITSQQRPEAAPFLDHSTAVQPLHCIASDCMLVVLRRCPIDNIRSQALTDGAWRKHTGSRGYWRRTPILWILIIHLVGNRTRVAPAWGNRFHFSGWCRRMSETCATLDVEHVHVWHSVNIDNCITTWYDHLALLATPPGFIGPSR